VICPFWDDLVINSSGGVKYQILGNVGSRHLIIQWTNAQFWGQGNSNPFTLTFQVVLYEGTNKIRFNYQNLTAGVPAQNEGHSATVGLKNANTDTGALSLDYNGSSGFSTYVGSGKSTLISPPEVAPDYYALTVAAGQTLSAVANVLTSGSLTLQLFDSSGSNLLVSGTTGPTNFSTGFENYVLPGAGTYYLAVGGTAGVPYSLSVLGNATADAEANDTAATAQPLGASHSVYGYAASTNYDWYSLVMPTGTNSLQLQTATPGDGTGEFVNTLAPVIRLYDSNGSTLIASGILLPDAHNQLLTASSLTAGATYLVQVSTANSTSGEYFLTTKETSSNPSVQSVTINNGDPERSMVTRIDVTFSTAVTIGSGAFNLSNGTVTLTSQANGGIQVGNSLVGGQTVATLTFDPSVNGTQFGSLSDGIWTIAVNAASVTAGGTPMAADYVQGGIKRLFGDGNGDGTVDGTDFGNFGNAFGLTFGPGGSIFDANNDGTVDGYDFGQFGNRFGLTL
jgi:hypothetical protein